jgi:hypothetical protein
MAYSRGVAVAKSGGVQFRRVALRVGFLLYGPVIRLGLLVSSWPERGPNNDQSGRHVVALIAGIAKDALHADENKSRKNERWIESQSLFLAEDAGGLG